MTKSKLSPIHVGFPAKWHATFEPKLTTTLSKLH